MQRALRLKKAAQDHRPKTPGGDKIHRRKSAGMAAGSSKPWMTK